MIDLLVCLIVSLFLSLIASPFVCLQDSFVSLIDLISCFFVCLLASSFLCLLLSLNVCKHVCLPNYLCVCAYSWLQLRLLAFFSTSLCACFSVYLSTTSPTMSACKAEHPPGCPYSWLHAQQLRHHKFHQPNTPILSFLLKHAQQLRAASQIPPAKQTHTFVFIEHFAAFITFNSIPLPLTQCRNKQHGVQFKSITCHTITQIIARYIYTTYIAKTSCISHIHITYTKKYNIKKIFILILKF